MEIKTSINKIGSAFKKWLAYHKVMDNAPKELFSDNAEITASFRVGHRILWSFALFISIMLIWAYFATIQEITRASGQVIASSKTQIVQSLEGGIVKDILVREGDPVNKGQILVRMDSTKPYNDFSAGEIKKAELEIRVLRVEAELDNTPFTVPIMVP